METTNRKVFTLILQCLLLVYSLLICIKVKAFTIADGLYDAKGLSFMKLIDELVERSFRGK
jgi:hypothetical protein